MGSLVRRDPQLPAGSILPRPLMLRSIPMLRNGSAALRLHALACRLALASRLAQTDGGPPIWLPYGPI